MQHNKQNHFANVRAGGEWATFLKNGIIMPIKTGAIMPSSQGLSLEMISHIDFSSPVSILEIGPGTGPITRQIARKIQPGSQFHGIELNRKFIHFLEKKHPEFTWHCGSAEDADILTEHRVFDHIICSLPWTNFPESCQIKILESIQKVSRQGTTFSTFAYLHGKRMKGGKRFNSLLKTYFPDYTVSKPIWRNIPPAVVYHGIAS